METGLGHDLSRFDLIGVGSHFPILNSTTPFSLSVCVEHLSLKGRQYLPTSHHSASLVRTQLQGCLQWFYASFQQQQAPGDLYTGPLYVLRTYVHLCTGCSMRCIVWCRFLVIYIFLLTVPLGKFSTSEHLDPLHCFLVSTISIFTIIRTLPW